MTRRVALQDGQLLPNTSALTTRKRAKTVGSAPPADTTMGRPSETTAGPPQPPVWEPSTAQRRYLQAEQEAVEGNEPYSDRALSAKLKMSRQTIYEWKHDDRFLAWHKREFNQTSDYNWALIIRRHEMLAMRGSVKSAEFLARVRYQDAKLAGIAAAAGESIDGTDPTTNYKVIIMVPRPEPFEGEIGPGE
jgi:hypothetical protein